MAKDEGNSTMPSQLEGGYCPYAGWSTLSIGEGVKIGDWTVQFMQINTSAQRMLDGQIYHPAIVRVFDSDGRDIGQYPVYPKQDLSVYSSSDKRAEIIHIGWDTAGTSPAMHRAEIWGRPKTCDKIVADGAAENASQEPNGQVESFQCAVSQTYQPVWLHIGENASVGDWKIRLQDISVAVGPQNTHPALFAVMDESGKTIGSELRAMPGEDTPFTRPLDGKTINIRVLQIGGITTLSDKSALVWAKPTNCSGPVPTTSQKPYPLNLDFSPLLGILDYDYDHEAALAKEMRPDGADERGFYLLGAQDAFDGYPFKITFLGWAQGAEARSRPASLFRVVRESAGGNDTVFDGIKVAQKTELLFFYHGRSYALKVGKIGGIENRPSTQWAEVKLAEIGSGEPSAEQKSGMLNAPYTPANFERLLCGEFAPERLEANRPGYRILDYGKISQVYEMDGLQLFLSDISRIGEEVPATQYYSGEYVIHGTLVVLNKQDKVIFKGNAPQNSQAFITDPDTGQRYALKIFTMVPGCFVEAGGWMEVWIERADESYPSSGIAYNRQATFCSDDMTGFVNVSMDRSGRVGAFDVSLDAGPSYGPSCYPFDVSLSQDGQHVVSLSAEPDSLQILHNPLDGKDYVLRVCEGDWRGVPMRIWPLD